MQVWSQHKEATNDAESAVTFVPHGVHEVTPQEKIGSAIELAHTLVHHLDEATLFYVQAFLTEHEFPTQEWATRFAERVGGGG